MDLLKDIDELLKSRGIGDYDDLRPDERETYFKMLELAEGSKITLEDFKKHVKILRQSVEIELSNYRPGWIKKLWEGDKDQLLKARLKNYLLFEAFFERPEKARDMLSQFKKTAEQRSV